MIQLSSLANSLVGSEIVKLGNAINEKKAQGAHIYNFTIGDFDPVIFPIPKELENLIVEKYQSHLTNYPPAAGVLALRQSVSHFLATQENLSYAPNEIMIASGGRPIIYTIFRTVVNPGDKVIYAVPSWNNNHYTHINGAVHCKISTTPENDFMPRSADIAPHIQDAALICLCTPQNPTGTTLSKVELEKICDMVIAENNRRAPDEKKLYILFDQMYWTLTFGQTEHFNPVSLRPEMKAYTLFVDGISKAFAATGVRVGWSMGPADVIAKMQSLLTHLGAWAPMAEQQAVADFLQQDSVVAAWFVDFKKAIYDRLHILYAGFQALKSKGYAVDAIAPQAAIYLTVKLDLTGKKLGDKTLLTQSDVTEYILDQAKLALVPFSAFGAEEDSPWYRISVGTSKIEDFPTVFSLLENALSQLNG